MEKNPPNTILLPEWFPKLFLETQWHIYSTDRNEDGRTPFVFYHISQREVTVYNGEILDSKKDFESIAIMNKENAEFHRDHIYKMAMSEIEARNLFVC